MAEPTAETPGARTLGGGTSSAAQLVAETIGISKRFGASQALSDVSVAIPAGDSRALVGRNGAGKSTLVAVLTGLIEPDGGRVRLAGADAPALAERARWRERVACVYQKSTVIPSLTVAENLFLNDHPTRAGLISWPALRRQAERALAEWGLEIDVTLEAARLTVEQRQIVEIARALRRGTRFIILDEPTAQLEAREVTRLFDRIARLQQSGVTFLYISHHLEEIYEVCRSVTVLRDGRLIATAPLAEMPKERVVAAMVGEVVREAERGARHGATPARPTRPPCLEIEGLHVGGIVDGVSLSVAPGECVGLAGLAGSGKEEVGDAVAGLVEVDSGEIRVAGAALRPGRVAEALRAGVGYVPRDRHARGIVPQLGVGENITMTIVERLGPAGLVLPAQRDREARRLIGDLHLVAASPDQPIGELSGGNQQKAVMGRALASNPKVLVLIAPTQGVDIASKQALFAIVEQARAAGTGVLVVSDDLDEFVHCDRVLVIFKGRLTAAFDADWSDEDLVAAIEGVGSGG